MNFKKVIFHESLPQNSICGESLDFSFRSETYYIVGILLTFIEFRKVKNMTGIFLEL